jgi:hypothetical protein
MADDSQFTDEHAPWFSTMTYARIFRITGTPYTVNAEWKDAYFHAARIIIEGVVNKTLEDDIDGVAGVYLFRHYVELALKYIVFHARWLKNANTNATDEDVQAVKKTHSLQELWTMAKEERKRKITDGTWSSFDVGFVEQCVGEFEAVDPNPGDRFRYFGRSFQRRPAEERLDPVHYLGIDYEALLYDMQHVYDVLEAIDDYLYETYGENASWTEFLNSL